MPPYRVAVKPPFKLFLLGTGIPSWTQSHTSALGTRINLSNITLRLKLKGYLELTAAVEEIPIGAAIIYEIRTKRFAAFENGSWCNSISSY